MKFIYILFWLLLSTVLSSCLGTRYLKDDEYLLYKQNIEGNEQIPTAALTEFYRQEPNNRVLFFPFSPYVYLYQWGLNHYDKEKLFQEKEETEEKFNQKIEEAEEESKENKVERLTNRKERKLDKLEKKIEEGNLLMQWGEPLAIYDSSLSTEANSQMLKYLHSKGFFLGNTAYETDTAGKKITVNFLIKEGEPYIFDSLMFTSSNENIIGLYNEHIEERLMEKGENYDEAVMAAERGRIDELLKNNGYYDFSRQYIEYLVDTSTLDGKGVMVETRILDPAKRGYHKVFTIDSVSFTTDASVTAPGDRKHEVYNHVDYFFYDYKYYKKILDRRLFINPDSLYSEENTFETQRQLSNLDIFKFININYDTTGGRFVANIFTSPLKKYTTSNEIGITIGEERIPGPFYNFTFTDRNVFGGLEILELSGRAGIEGVASPSDPGEAFSSQEIGGNLSITFPQFILPISENLRSRLGRLNPKTHLLTGYHYRNRQDYDRTNAKISATYTWQKEEKVYYNFSLADVSLINSSNITDEWQQRLDEFKAQGNQLYRSFEPSFVSSMIFYTIFNFGQYGSYNGNEAGYLKLFFESGGTLQNLTGTELYQNLGDSLQFFKYLKFSADWRQYLPLSNGNVFAYRINIGIANPYGENNTLPYEKFFFAGGSNSIRAWQPRRLGPGSYTPPDSLGSYKPSEDGPINRSFEQQGELILEANFEIRRNLIGFLDGAFFIDAGNVWSLDNDPRDGAKFEFKDFWKEIAIGTGIGFRFDFNFLVLRLDVGVKVLDPAQPEGERFVLDQIGFGKPYDENYPLVFNIGIGYPF